MSAYEKKCQSCGRVFRDERDFLSFGHRFRICSAQALWFNCTCDSTLFIPAGEFPWYQPGRELSPGAKSVFEKIRQKTAVPYLSATAMELQTALKDQSLSPDDIARKLRAEPVLASSLFEVANAQVLGSGQKIASLQHAVVFIGRQKLGETLQIAAVRQLAPQTRSFNVEKFWKDAFASGFIAEELVSRLKLEVPRDDAYLAASLANIGKLMSALVFPEETDKIYLELTVKPRRVSWLQVERDFLDTTHQVLGEIAASFWGLPKAVTDAAGGHHNNNHLFRGRSFSLTDIAAASVQLSHWMIGEPFQIDQLCLKNFMRLASLDESALDKLMIDLGASYQERLSKQAAAPAK